MRFLLGIIPSAEDICACTAVGDVQTLATECENTNCVLKARE